MIHLKLNISLRLCLNLADMEIIQLMSVIIKLSDPYIVEETELAPRKVVG